MTSHEHHWISNHWQLFSTACSDQQQRKHQSSALLALCEGNPSGSHSSQKISNAESTSTPRCHHVQIQWHHVFCQVPVAFNDFNTLRPRQNGRHKISLNFVPKGPINNITALVQIMAWRRPGYLKQWWLIYRRIYASLGLNELKPFLLDRHHSEWVNTLSPRQDGCHFPDIFICIFLNENVWILIKISLKFVPKGPINKIPSLVQIRIWRRPGTKQLSEPMMVSLLTHICVTRPQWVKQSQEVWLHSDSQQWISNIGFTREIRIPTRFIFHHISPQNKYSIDFNYLLIDVLRKINSRLQTKNENKHSQVGNILPIQL